MAIAARVSARKDRCQHSIETVDWEVDTSWYSRWYKDSSARASCPIMGAIWRSRMRRDQQGGGIERRCRAGRVNSACGSIRPSVRAISRAREVSTSER